eukprot:CAMPEP_0172502928 /NCGR_PEP_ID=MMETSP1066-20121228/164255_1 /TAXON_ID=671091 /ORGANISM="Coscinodiscus wailesii, Strain CCMP2513" /LENGTH=225 /DNA_ID=CAMNT_0013278399 /DNA_START=53 /DNA_END=727 /DNA_ORIENTATION=+
MAKSKRDERAPEIKETIDSSDDEEISEDEAFNSDDERKYGAFFPKDDDDSSSSDSDDDDNSSDDDSDDESTSDEKTDGDDDGGAYMLSLLENLDKPKTGTTSTTSMNNSHLPESEHGVSSTGSKLTMQSLLAGITDTKSFTPLQKQMHSLLPTPSGGGGSSTTTTPAPSSKPVTNRHRQTVNYTSQKKELNRYNDVCRANRDATTLDFRGIVRRPLTERDLVGTF